MQVESATDCISPEVNDPRGHQNREPKLLSTTFEVRSPASPWNLVSADVFEPEHRPLHVTVLGGCAALIGLAAAGRITTLVGTALVLLFSCVLFYKSRADLPERERSTVDSAEPDSSSSSPEHSQAAKPLWAKIDGLPSNEGPDHPFIETKGIATVEDMRNACITYPDCVGFAYRVATPPLKEMWVPKQGVTGFDPDKATFNAHPMGETWEWHYIVNFSQVSASMPTKASMVSSDSFWMSRPDSTSSKKTDAGDRCDFGFGVAYCERCQSLTRYRGCGVTNKVICSKCWPDYVLEMEMQDKEFFSFGPILSREGSPNGSLHPTPQQSPQHSPRAGRRPLPVAAYEHDTRVEFHKRTWKILGKLGPRHGMDMMFPPPTINYYDKDARPGVGGHVALTIDDAPCRSRDSENSMVPEILALLDEFGAKATFFVIAEYAIGHDCSRAVQSDCSVQQLLRAGHEIGNHGCADRSYHKASEAEFEAMLLGAEEKCNQLRRDAEAPVPAVRWFRAPQARMNKVMTQVLHKHGFQNVFGDAYANDPWILDPKFVTEETLNSATDGSIIIIHMPEHGFREHCYVALRGILEGLRDRYFNVVTLSSLNHIACQWSKHVQVPGVELDTMASKGSAEPHRGWMGLRHRAH